MLILSLLAVSPLVVKLILELVEKNNLTTLRNKRKYDKLFLIICGILITFVMGFRGMASGSPDTEAYSNFFIGVSKQKNLWGYLGTQIEGKIIIFSEVGFNLFMWLLSRISSNPQLLILTTSAFIVGSVMRFIYKNSQNVFLSVILFLCLGLFSFSMNGMRQALAMAICLWAYEFAKRDKFWRFLLIVLVAMFFHKTAIVFFVVYFVKFFKFDAKSIILFLVILAIFVALIPVIVKYLDEVYDKNYSEGESRDSGGIAQIGIYVVVLVLAIIFNNALRKKEGKNYLYLTILAFFFFLLRFIGSLMFERISYYFSYFLILLIPTIVEYSDEKDKSILMMIFVILPILLFVYRTNASFGNFYLCF